MQKNLEKGKSIMQTKANSNNKLAQNATNTPRLNLTQPVRSIINQSSQNSSRNMAATPPNSQTAPSNQHIKFIDFEKLANAHIPSSTQYTDKDLTAQIENLSIEFRENANIIWMSTGEICEDAQLGIDDLQLSLPVQKQLGDCWFVSAAYALFSQTNLGKKLLKQVFLNQDENDFKTKNFTTVRFFIEGSSLNCKYLNVTVENSFPANKVNKNLIYGCCEDKNKFWFAILEKAYAKLYGCNYENIVAGVSEEALIDLCGALTLYLNPQNASDLQTIVAKLNYMKQRGNLIACADTLPLKISYQVNAKVASAMQTRNHSFIILDIKSNGNSSTIVLKNPWSNQCTSFNHLTSLNVSKNASETSKNIIELKLSDFSKHFGALSMALYLPSDDDCNLYHHKDCLGRKNSLNLLVKTGKVTNKSHLVDHLQETCHFYLMEIGDISKSTEFLFNFTQYRAKDSRLMKREIKMSLLNLSEANGKLVAKYASRSDFTRNGRTLSKLIEMKRSSKYLFILSVTNDSEGLISDNEKTNYIFRCVPLLDIGENFSRENVNLTKVESLSGDSNVILDVDCCKTCEKVFFTGVKFFVGSNNTKFCSDCRHGQTFGISKGANSTLNNLIQNYADLE